MRIPNGTSGRWTNRLAIAVALGLSVPILSAPTALAQAEAAKPELPDSGYVAQDVMIPMRDGVKLHAQVWRPKGSTEKLPIMMTRSPYGFTVRADRSRVVQGQRLSRARRGQVHLRLPGHSRPLRHPKASS
jgi:predicted acyl esterase